jgi:Flp pilus assembly pilin Flp
MWNSALWVYVQIQALKCALKDESGQDMVEYAIVLSLIATGAVVAMNGLAASISTGFTSVSGKVSNYIS